MMVRGELAMTEEKKPDRNWKEYNEHLVQRGEILLAVESLQGWAVGSPPPRRIKIIVETESGS